MVTPRITVLGSLNIDHTIIVDRIPRPGETVLSKGRLFHYGGKGANQAVAAARAGARVRLIGCVGRDDRGSAYKTQLGGEGIDVSGVETAADDQPTGSAFITVDDQGENTITVHAGANAGVDCALVDRQRIGIELSDLLLAQLECPLEAVAHATRRAKGKGLVTLLNPSPLSAAFSLGDFSVDFLIANESEALGITRLTELDLGRLNEWVDRQEIVALIVTRGAKSTLVVVKGEEGWQEVAPPKVRPVNTVGAGDSFAGAFAAALGEGRPLREAVTFANVAGALATLQQGAQNAIPRRGMILEAMHSNR